MRYLIRFMCVVALGVVLLVGCSETAGARMEEEPCRFPLSDYCEGAECPSWDQAVAKAEEDGRQEPEWCWVVSGACANLRYIMTGVGLGGVLQYFDDSGALVARKVFEDVPTFCNDTSFQIWYGAPPDCEQEPSRNFCMGWGEEYCAAVEQCGSGSEAECLARYDDPACWGRWDSYVGCFSGDGTCESCAERLPEWQACTAPQRGR
jgi:hypothetical protein